MPIQYDIKIVGPLSSALSSVPDDPSVRVSIGNPGHKRDFEPLKLRESTCFYCKAKVYGHKCQNCGAPA